VQQWRAFAARHSHREGAVKGPEIEGTQLLRAAASCWTSADTYTASSTSALSSTMLRLAGSGLSAVEHRRPSSTRPRAGVLERVRNCPVYGGTCRGGAPRETLSVQNCAVVCRCAASGLNGVAHATCSVIQDSLCHPPFAPLGRRWTCKGGEYFLLASNTAAEFSAL